MNRSTRSPLVGLLCLLVLSWSAHRGSARSAAQASCPNAATMIVDHPPGPALLEALASRLGDLLENADLKVRRAAAEGLTGLGPAAKMEVPRIIRATGGSDVEIANIVSPMFEKMADKGFAQLARAIRNGDMPSRVGALRLLERTGSSQLWDAPTVLPKKNWSIVVDALRDETTEVRMAAAETLTGYCVLSKAGDELVVPALIRRLKEDRNVAVRQACAMCLLNMGTRAKAAAPMLDKILRKAEGDEGTAAWALARTGKEGLDFLVAILKDPKMSHLNESVLRALPYSTCDAAPAIPLVAERLASKDSNDRIWAIYCLRKLGPVAKAAEPDLRTLLDDTDVEIRVRVVWALAEIGVPLDDACVSLLIKGLHNDDSQIRFNTFQTVNQLGKKAGKLVPHLINVFKEHEDEKMREWAGRALGCIGEAAKDAVPALKEGLNDKSKKIQQIAEWALDGIEGKGKEKR